MGFEKTGEVAEWSKAHAWKVCIPRETVSRVRIPLSPPSLAEAGRRSAKASFADRGEKFFEENLMRAAADTICETHDLDKRSLTQGKQGEE